MHKLDFSNEKKSTKQYQTMLNNVCYLNNYELVDSRPGDPM